MLPLPLVLTIAMVNKWRWKRISFGFKSPEFAMFVAPQQAGTTIMAARSALPVERSSGDQLGNSRPVHLNETRGFVMIYYQKW